MFPDLEALQMPYSWDFREVINSISVPLFSLENVGMGLKIPSFFSWLCLFGNQPPSRSHPGAYPELPH